MDYEPVIGLEVHIHLKTRTKAFCGCSTEFGAQPNTQVCPVCLGFPGSLPVLNQEVLEHAIKVGLALNLTVQEFTKFDRKHYYYPDLPKNYQISQYDLPVSKDGFLDILVDGKNKRVKIKRAHLEEDAGKLIHTGELSLVDFNRTGMPLLEIVTEPDIFSPQEAYEYLTALKCVIQYVGVSDCDMEKGSLRCDANISVRPQGTQGLGTKAELKNMNSFKGVRDALAFEIQRQKDLINGGGEVVQETRLWDEKEGKTHPMRSKEEAKDYRYFPDPDLPPFIITKDKIDAIRRSLPELPARKAARFREEYGLSEYDARILTATKETADFAEQLFKKYPRPDKKPVANWLIGPLASIASANNTTIASLPIPDRMNELSDMFLLTEESKISHLAAKGALQESVDTQKPISAIIKEKDLFQVSDAGALDAHIESVLKENEKVAQDFKTGKDSALMFLVGQVMKKSKGKANPKVVGDMLRRRLKTDA